MKQEDKRILDGIIGNLEYLLSIEDCDELAHNLRNRISWVKTLKDRVLPQIKQEWDEEDEKNSSYICAALDCYYRLREDKNNTNGQEDLDKARNWLYNKLKSLRPQNRWKPSDEQMKALEVAIQHIDRKNFINANPLLISLYESLKKLKD